MKIAKKIFKIGNWKLEISNQLRCGNSKLSLGGYSIIEMLVVIAVFSVIAVVATQSLANSLRGSRKSDAQSRARQNVDFAMSTMERLLRNAKSRTCTSNIWLDYTDEYGKAGRFRCIGGANGYIASGSGNLRMTSPEVKIDCNNTIPKPVFNCPAVVDGVPPSIFITIKGTDINTSGAEGSSVTSQSKILLRTYN